MKTKRVQRNGSGFQAAEQSKIKAPELAITVFDYDKDTNIFQRNLSAHEAVAIGRACKSKGLALNKIIKTAIDGAVEAAQDFRSAETQKARKQPEIPATSRPDICEEAADAFIELDNAASAAIALMSLNASNIENCIHDYAGWDDFDTVYFMAGNDVLPHLLAAKFEREFLAWDTGRNRVVELLKRHKFADAGAPLVSHEVEDAVNALIYLVKLQGDEISRRLNDSSIYCSSIVAEGLQSAFDKAWKAFSNLIRDVRPENAIKIPQAA